jgi:hypothetical protein
MKPTFVVAEVPNAALLQEALKQGFSLGWKLISFDATLPKPVVVFERERPVKEQRP